VKEAYQAKKKTS
jgi:hypothetical protein